MVQPDGNPALITPPVMVTGGWKVTSPADAEVDLLAVSKQIPSAPPLWPSSHTHSHSSATALIHARHPPMPPLRAEEGLKAPSSTAAPQREEPPSLLARTRPSQPFSALHGPEDSRCPPQALPRPRCPQASAAPPGPQPRRAAAPGPARPAPAALTAAGAAGPGRRGAGRRRPRRLRSCRGSAGRSAAPGS